MEGRDNNQFGDPQPGPPMGSPQAKALKTLEHELAITMVNELHTLAGESESSIINLGKRWELTGVSENVEGRSFTFAMTNPDGHVIEFRISIKATGNYYRAPQPDPRGEVKS